MKHIAAMLLVLTLALSLSNVAFATGEAPDARTETAYPQTIAAGLRLGIIGYMSGEEYRPLDTITRAEFAQMLYNAFAENPVEATDDTVWWEPAVNWLYANTVQRNFTAGDEALAQITAAFYGGQAGVFRPNDSASIDFMIEMLYLVECVHGQMAPGESLHDAAFSWADRYGCGPNSDYLNWRFISSGDQVVRAEAIALVACLDRSATD